MIGFENMLDDRERAAQPRGLALPPGAVVSANAYETPARDEEHPRAEARPVLAFA